MSSCSELAESFVKPLRDANRLVELISQLTKASDIEIRRRLKLEYAEMGTNVAQAMRDANIVPYVWSEQLERFYEQTDAFLYETIVWNLTHAKCDLRSWIGKYLNDSNAPKRVLTFGDGLGFDAYFLASIGFDVTYFEVSQPCAQFAQSIFDDGQVSIEVLTDPSRLDDRIFDTIVCLDVLEHVPDPPALVQWLSGLLAPQGRLVVSAPFYLVNSSVPTHLRSNRHFSGDYRRLYKPAGLHPVDGRLFWNPIVLQKGDVRPIPWKLKFGSALLRPGRFLGAPYAMTSDSIVEKKHPLSLE